MGCTMETAVEVLGSFFSPLNECKGSGVYDYTSLHEHGSHLLGRDSEN